MNLVEVSIIVQGQTRTYWVSIPSSGAVDKPVWFCVHGRNGNGRKMIIDNLFDLVAEEVVLIGPNGTYIDGNGVRGWNTRNLPPGPNDFAFFAALREAAIELGCDADRMAVVGHSYGAAMTWALRVHLPEVAAAFAPVANSPASWYEDNVLLPRYCWYKHGTDDTITPYGEPFQPNPEWHMGFVAGATWMFDTNNESVTNAKRTKWEVTPKITAHRRIGRPDGLSTAVSLTGAGHPFNNGPVDPDTGRPAFDSVAAIRDWLRGVGLM